MNLLDWIVLAFTLVAIVGYGTWRTRRQRDLNTYLRGGQEANWLTVGLSVMATQASAITFLSAPGQAFESGMGFIQFYFGLPLALVLVSVFVVPLFFKLNVYTAYEYLEQRFHLNVRLLTAFLFLVQRGLAAGITIYAPAIVLSTVLGWDLQQLILIIGVLVIIYTVSGGTKAVSITQKWQMSVIMAGMFFAFFTLLNLILPTIGFSESMSLAGAMGRMDIVSYDIDLESRYTIWSGLTGGLFLSLSYFGTDQSQVQRYISASSIKQSRMGLMFNAILKIPMQFFILFTGVLLFVFYQFNDRPINFNEQVVESVLASEHASEGEDLMAQFQDVQSQKHLAMQQGQPNHETMNQLLSQEEAIVANFNALAEQADPTEPTKDADYIFIRFVLDYLPHGAIGLLLAVILSAAMSSTAGELNALASTTMNDFFKRLSGKGYADNREVFIGKMITVGWGIMAISFALAAELFENLIELVNILGSLFYGTILGIFLCAFFTRISSHMSIMIAALIAECVVLGLFIAGRIGWIDEIGFLWFNVIGAAIVVLMAVPLNQRLKVRA